MMMNLLLLTVKYFSILRSRWGEHSLKNILKVPLNQLLQLHGGINKQDQWAILILDTKNQLNHTKAKNKEIIPVSSEQELLSKFLDRMEEISPDILVGYNSDYFDIPYLYSIVFKKY